MYWCLYTLELILYAHTGKQSTGNRSTTNLAGQAREGVLGHPKAQCKEQLTPIDTGQGTENAAQETIFCLNSMQLKFASPLESAQSQNEALRKE